MSDPAPATFTFGGVEHRVGDRTCIFCYNAPEVCRCSGIVHTDLDDDELSAVCDRCGDEWEIV